MDLRLNPLLIEEFLRLHFHSCHACQQVLVCCCDNKDGQVFCFACQDLQERLKKILGETASLEWVN